MVLAAFVFGRRPQSQGDFFDQGGVGITGDAIGSSASVAGGSTTTVGPGTQIPPGGIPPGGLPGTTVSTPTPGTGSILGAPIPNTRLNLPSPFDIPVVPVTIGGLTIAFPEPPRPPLIRTASANVTDWLKGIGLKTQIGSGGELQGPGGTPAQPQPGLSIANLSNSPLAGYLGALRNLSQQAYLDLGLARQAPGPVGPAVITNPRNALDASDRALVNKQQVVGPQPYRAFARIQ